MVGMFQWRMETIMLLTGHQATSVLLNDKLKWWENENVYNFYNYDIWKTNAQADHTQLMDYSHACRIVLSLIDYMAMQSRTINLIFFLTKWLSSFWIDFQQSSKFLLKFNARNQSVSTFQSLQNSVIHKYVLFLHKQNITIFTQKLSRLKAHNINILKHVMEPRQ